MNSQCSNHKKNDDGFFFHFETMLQTKCESINSPCYQTLWYKRFLGLSEKTVTPHSHPLPLSVTLETKIITQPAHI